MSNIKKMIEALKDIAEDRKTTIKAKISSADPLTVKSLMESLTKTSGQVIRIDSIFMNSLASDDLLDITTLLSYQSVKSVLQQSACDEVSLLGPTAAKSDISEEDYKTYLDMMTDSGLKLFEEYYSD